MQQSFVPEQPTAPPPPAAAHPPHRYGTKLLPQWHKKSALRIRKDGGLDMRFNAAKRAIGRSAYAQPLNGVPPAPRASACASLFGSGAQSPPPPVRRDFARAPPLTSLTRKRAERTECYGCAPSPEFAAVALTPNQCYAGADCAQWPSADEAAFAARLTPACVAAAVRRFDAGDRCHKDCLA